MSFEPTELLRKPGEVDNLIDYCLLGMLIRHTSYDDLDEVSRQLKKVLDVLDQSCVTNRKSLVNKINKIFKDRNSPILCGIPR